MNLIPHNMHLTETNIKKIANAIKHGTEAILQFAHHHLSGPHLIPLLKSQFERVKKVYIVEKD